MNNGLIYDYHPEGIHIYRFRDIRRQTIDAWITLGVRHDEEALKQGLHIRSLLDFQGHWVTPYLAARTLEVTKSNSPDLRESVAVLGNKTASAFFQATMRRLPSSIQPNVQFFSQESMAMEWLRLRLEKLGP